MKALEKITPLLTQLRYQQETTTVTIQHQLQPA